MGCQCYHCSAGRSGIRSWTADDSGGFYPGVSYSGTGHHAACPCDECEDARYERALARGDLDGVDDDDDYNDDDDDY